MRATVFTLLFVAGCLGFDSEPDSSYGSLSVHVTSPAMFDRLDVTLPDAGYVPFDSRSMPSCTEFEYGTSNQPPAVAFGATFQNVAVASGTLPEIHYTNDGGGDFHAELAITLTAIAH